MVGGYYLLDQGIPTMVVGDFNCILRSEEKRGGRPYTENISFRECAHFLQSNGLVDLGFIGPCFTWCNNRSGGARVWERLDKVFATSSWIQGHPAHFVRHLARIASDHCPVLPTTDKSISCHPPIRFEKF